MINVSTKSVHNTPDLPTYKRMQLEFLVHFLVRTFKGREEGRHADGTKNTGLGAQ